DKVQQSMKGYKGRSGAENVASFDIVLQLRAPKSGSDVGRNGRVRKPARSARDLVLSSVTEHLSRAQADAYAERTLPYLYSLSVATLLNAGVSLRGHSMDSLRELLRSVTVEAGGRWFLAESAPPEETAGRRKRVRERAVSS